MQPVSSSSGKGKTSPVVVNFPKKDRIQRLENFSQIELSGNEFPKLPINTDVLASTFYNEFWKNRLKEKFAQKKLFPSDPSLHLDLFARIDQIVKESLNQSCIPQNNNQSITKEFLNSLDFEPLFIAIIRKRLSEIKRTYEQIAVAIEERTEAGIKFHEQITKLAEQTKLFSFINGCEDIRKSSVTYYALVIRCLGFDKKCKFEQKITTCYEKVRLTFSNLVSELAQFQDKNKRITDCIQEKELRCADIDKFPMEDVNRSLLGENGRNLEILVNNQPVLNRNNSYYQGLVYQIHSILSLPTTEEEVIKHSALMMKKQEVPHLSRMFRLGSINAWSHAVELIKKSKFGFNEIPFITRFKQGIECGITIRRKDCYDVTQIKTLLVHKREKPKDTDCLSPEGAPICSITFRATFKVENERIKLSVDIIDWAMNPDSEINYKWLAYRILSSHVRL